MTGSFPTLSTLAIILLFKKPKRKMERQWTMKCFKTSSILKEIVKKKTSKRPQRKEFMKQSAASQLMKMRKLRSVISHLRSSLSSSDTLMRVQSEKIPKKLPKKKRIRRRDSSRPRDHLLPKRRRQTWPAWMSSTWSRA